MLDHKIEIENAHDLIDDAITEFREMVTDEGAIDYEEMSNINGYDGSGAPITVIVSICSAGVIGIAIEEGHHDGGTWLNVGAETFAEATDERIRELIEIAIELEIEQLSARIADRELEAASAERFIESARGNAQFFRHSDPSLALAFEFMASDVAEGRLVPVAPSFPDEVAF
jgi:hypothetical protein